MPRFIKHIAPVRPFTASPSHAIDLFDAKPYQELIVNEANAANDVRELHQNQVLHIAQRQLLFLQSAFVNTTYSTIKRRHHFVVCQEIQSHIMSGGDFRSLSDCVLCVIKEIDAEGTQYDFRN